MEDALTYEEYYHIAYRRHRIMNPLPDRALPLFSDLAGLNADSHILDIGSGKGYTALGITKHCGTHSTQVDISPVWTAQAAELFAQQRLEHNSEILTADAREFNISLNTYDMIICLGNSPIYGGFHEAVETFLPGLKKGGTLLMGEATIRENVPEEFLANLESLEWMLPTENELLLTIEEHELALLYARRSSREEWDEYMGLQWVEVNNYIASNPRDKIVPELRDWLEDEQETYLRFQRHYLDWTVFLLRKTL